MLLLRLAFSSILPLSIRSSRSSWRSFHGHAAASTAVAAAAAPGPKKGNLSCGRISATGSGGSRLGAVAAFMRFSTGTKTAPAAAAAVDSKAAAAKDWSPEDPDGQLPPSLKIQDNPPTGAMLSATWEHRDLIIQAEANNPLLQEQGDEGGRICFPLEVRFLSKGEESGRQVKLDGHVHHGLVAVTSIWVGRQRIKPGGVIDNRQLPAGLEGPTHEFDPEEFLNGLWRHDGIRLSATIPFIYYYLANKQKADHGA